MHATPRRRNALQPLSACGSFDLVRGANDTAIDVAVRRQRAKKVVARKRPFPAEVEFSTHTVCVDCRVVPAARKFAFMRTRVQAVSVGAANKLRTTEYAA